MQLGHRHRQARMRLASPPLALLLSLPNLEVTLGRISVVFSTPKIMNVAPLHF